MDSAYQRENWGPQAVKDKVSCPRIHGKKWHWQYRIFSCFKIYQASQRPFFLFLSTKGHLKTISVTVASLLPRTKMG